MPKLFLVYSMEIKLYISNNAGIMLSEDIAAAKLEVLVSSHLEKTGAEFCSKELYDKPFWKASNKTFSHVIPEY